jgi:hypothetical protein
VAEQRQARPPEPRRAQATPSYRRAFGLVPREPGPACNAIPTPMATRRERFRPDPLDRTTKACNKDGEHRFSRSRIASVARQVEEPAGVKGRLVRTTIAVVSGHRVHLRHLRPHGYHPRRLQRHRHHVHIRCRCVRSRNERVHLDRLLRPPSRSRIDAEPGPCHPRRPAGRQQCRRIGPRSSTEKGRSSPSCCWGSCST